MVIEVKGNKKSETVEKTDKREKKEIKEKERKPCNECRYYDHSTERDFHRKVGPRNDKGERTEIIEIRAVCRNPKASAFKHLVHATLTRRECSYWKEGKYEPSKKETKTLKKENEEKKTAPSEYHGPPLTEVEEKNLKEKKKRPKAVAIKNPLNGETKTLVKKRGKVFVEK